MRYRLNKIAFHFASIPAFRILAVLTVIILVYQTNYVQANKVGKRVNYPLEDLKGVHLGDFFIDNNVCALLVSHNGVLKLAKFNKDAADGDMCSLPKGNDQTKKPEIRDTEYSLASMAKSVTSTLLGTLIYKTGTPNIHDNIGSIFSDLEKGSYGCRTVEDVLLMNGGINSRYELNSMVGRAMTLSVQDDKDSSTFFDFIKGITRKKECKKRDKNQYFYQAIDSTMFGLVAQKYLIDETGLESLPDAYIEWIWKETDMKGTMKWKGENRWKWKEDDDDKWGWKEISEGVAPKGMIAPACCMYAHPKDMIKFGEYILKNYLAESNSDETPVRDWLHASEENAVPTKAFPNCCFPPVYKDYGYQWWHLGDKDRNYDELGFSAIGRGGQFIHIIPKYNTVIVQFSSLKNKLDNVQCDSFRIHREIIRSLNKYYANNNE